MNMVSKQGFFDALEPNAQEIALAGRRVTPRQTQAFIARATREWMLATNPDRIERGQFAKKMCEELKIGAFHKDSCRVYFADSVIFDTYFDVENGGFFRKDGSQLTTAELINAQKQCGIYVEPVVEVTNEVIATEQTASASEEQTIAALVNTIIDRPLIDRCLKIMAANHNPANRLAKSKFEDARVLISKERAKLASAGFRCAALGIAATSNVNRHERDSVTQITAQNWLDISRVEAE